jgi:hypothetical protein
MTGVPVRFGSVAAPASVRSAPLRFAAALGAGLALDVAFDPQQRHVPLCPLHALTGIWCPLCGGLRAADSLAHGRVVEALHENALFVTSLPLLCAGWLYWFFEARAGRPRPTLPRAVTVLAVVVAIAFAIVRNLPGIAGLRGS